MSITTRAAQGVRQAKQSYDGWYDRKLAPAYATAAMAGRQAFADSRGQGTNMVGLFIGLLIATIVVVQVFIPVVFDAIADAGDDLDGTTETIVELLPLFAALLLLIALAAPLMRRL